MSDFGATDAASEILPATFSAPAGFLPLQAPTHSMKRDPSSGDLEQDPIWDLLRQSPSSRPAPDFAARVTRAARLASIEPRWWNRPWLPATLVGGLAAAAAITLALLPADPFNSPTPADSGAADSLAGLQEDYEAEVLLAASEHLANYSDEELVAMVGF